MRSSLTLLQKAKSKGFISYLPPELKSAKLLLYSIMNNETIETKG